MFTSVTHCTPTTKEGACRRICRLRQQTSPKRWFANAHMTSYYDGANSVYPAAYIQQWPPYAAAQHWNLVGGIQSKAVAPHIAKPLHVTGH